MLEFEVTARRIDAHGSVALCKSAELTLVTDESENRLELLHENVRKYGTVFNTVKAGVEINGSLIRKQP